MRRFTLIAALGILFSCGVEPGSSLQILATLAPDASCNYELSETTARYFSSGTYDPWGNGLLPSSSYQMVIGMQNHMERTDDDPAQGADGNVRVNTRDVTILGFETCWLDVTDGLNIDIARAGCDDAPDKQRGFEPSNFLVQAGGGVAMGDVRVLNLTALQSLFGSGFDPRLLEAVGPITEASLAQDLNFDGDQVDTFLFPSPGLPDVNANQAWGNFPEAGIATVLVKVRAVGKTLSGGAVESNWHSFPVDVCVGCGVAACGILEVISCVPSGVGLEGFEPEIGADSCLPFQDNGIGGSCVEATGCAAPT